ncbi:MFS transporter [Bartonella sp. HY761]|uniref:MFS transporter n=1 Tax=Bartonella sp. HY761 TaxID=2979330 RepID=UPI0021E1E836|nr:MFS transporter [Bartonella sp. HY761]UXN07961.1 MHS family MFS transporter [Bartonella sp. HY761]
MRKPQPIRAALAAFLGTAIEWYDFYIYGTAAALVFGQLFFPSESSYLGNLAALGTFAVGFIARPFGAAIFGHFGDKLGRRLSLVITLLIMGGVTTLIGALPTYESIGMYAAILLVFLRLIQGIAVGGEWGGAVLIAAEHAPEKWRTFLASAPQYGSPVGLILATLAFRYVSDLPTEDLMSWGWRIPFLASGVLVLLAFIIRLGINESPEMQAQLDSKSSHEIIPIKELLAKKSTALILGIGACILGVAGFYFITTFMINYTTTYLKIEKSTILNIISWVGVVEIISFPIGSFLATRYSERGLLMTMTGLGVIWALPMMLLVVSGSTINIAIAILVATFLVGAYYAVIAPFLPRAFPVRMRYSGISLSYQLCGAIFGGATPMVGVWLAHYFGTNWVPFAGLFGGLALITFLCVWALPIENEKSVLHTYKN